MSKRNIYCFIFALLVIGAGGMIAQTVLLRELLIVFTGNELSMGVIIGSWVIWEALGAWLAGKWAGRLATNIRLLTYLNAFFSLFFLLSIYGTRTFKVLAGLPPEVGVGIVFIFSASLLILLPVGLVHGFLFTLACTIWNQLTEEGATSSGKVYFYEMTGTIVGGLFVNYLLIPFYQSFLIAAIIAFFCVVASLMLTLSFFRLEERVTLVLNTVLGILLLFLLFGNGADRLHQWAVEGQWQHKNVVSYENSPYQNIVVVKSEDQYTFFSDGLPFMTTPLPDIAFVEEFVHIPMLSHPSPENVLILGGGAGGIINEVLKYRTVSRIDYVEMDPLLLKTVARFPTPLTQLELQDPRVHLHFLDGRIFLRGTSSRYDVVLLGFPPPHSLRQNRFFTEEFFGTVKRALKTNGLAALNMTGSLSYYSTELKELNLSIMNTLTRAFPYLYVVPGDLNLFIVSDSPEILLIFPALLSERLKSRNIETRLVNKPHLAYRMSPDKREWFDSNLQGPRVPVNRDFSPKGLFYNIAYENLLFSPFLASFFKVVKAIRPGWVLLFVAALFLLFMLAARKERRIAVAYVMGTTGFTAMILELILLFAFQIFYGYVFYEIGILFTLFMAGLAAGSLLVTGGFSKRTGPIKLLRVTEVSHLAFSLMLFFVFSLPDPARLSGSPLLYPFFLLSLFITGLLAGAEFPLATLIHSLWSPAPQRETGDSLGKTVGLLYSADLFGGWIGGITGGLLLLPVLGLPVSCLLLAALKASSLLVFLMSDRRVFSKAR